MHDAVLFRRGLAARILGLVGVAALAAPLVHCSGIDGGSGGAGGAGSAGPAPGTGGAGGSAAVQDCFAWTADQGPCPTGEHGVLYEFTCCGCPTGWEPKTIVSGPMPKTGDQCCYMVDLQLCSVGGRPYLVDERARVAPAERGARGWSGPGAVTRGGLTADERAALAEAWTRDALAEHASVASFARFSLALLGVGAPADLVERAHRAALDEIRHAELCFALASAYAGEELAPGPFPLGDDMRVGATLLEIAVSAVHEGCVGETVAAVVAAEQLARATDPAVRAALAEIVADEARHAELAWATVTWAARAGGAEVRAAIARALFDALAGGRGAPSPGAAAPGALEAHGRLDAATVARVAAGAMTDVVGPAARALCCGGAG
jgi:hypothetical protein